MVRQSARRSDARPGKRVRGSAASVKYIEAIDPDSAGFQSSGQAVRFGDVTSPNGCGQSIAGYSDGVERVRARWIAAF